MLMFRPLLRYAVFNGRARRAEYWLFVLFQGFLVGGCLALAFSSLGGAQENPGPALAGFITWFGLTGLVALALVLPYYAVLVRRLHDIGQSGWWALLLLPGAVTPFFLGQSLAGAVAGVGAGANPDAAGAALVQAFAQGMAFVAVASLCNLVLFVMTLLPGTHGPNRFGPDPRDPNAIGGGPSSLYDDDRMDELFAQAKREREGDYKPVFDFGPGSQDQPQPVQAQARVQAEPAPPPRQMDWDRPAWDPGVAPTRPFGKRSG